MGKLLHWQHGKDEETGAVGRNSNGLGFKIHCLLDTGSYGTRPSGPVSWQEKNRSASFLNALATGRAFLHTDSRITLRERTGSINKSDGCGEHFQYTVSAPAHSMEYQNTDDWKKLLGIGLQTWHRHQ
jgi:hypothetical protein